MSALAAVLLLAHVGTATPGPVPAGPQDSVEARRQVVEVVQRVMDAMATKDTARLLGAFAPGASLWGMRSQNGKLALQQIKAEEFAAYVARDTRGKWDERLGQAEVRIDGSMATVWVPYQFYLSGKFSHCGIDAFQLLKSADGWKIVSLADTYREEGCGRQAG